MGTGAMDVGVDVVAGAVGEVFAVAFLLDHFPANEVHLKTFNDFPLCVLIPNKIGCGLLSGAHKGEELSLFWRGRLVYHSNTGNVSIDRSGMLFFAPKVDEHKISPFDLARTLFFWLKMGVGAVCVYRTDGQPFRHKPIGL